MKLNDVSGLIVDTAYQIHTDLGKGLYESVYEVIPAGALQRHELTVER